ncbi:uncharacterized protein FOMMEDRAFT_153461 [Fomitiporia mediterranea MF3/22]|nr:uncharacterized protein FOMMEDRAFT_153461 [Fomitiporia mediterranea MF3/22]EJD06098.1 hypothetical protein FOMMEDRAFT_153461 [Fomitiporia mediterranea MF3/22]
MGGGKIDVGVSEDTTRVVFHADISANRAVKYLSISAMGAARCKCPNKDF